MLELKTKSGGLSMKVAGTIEEIAADYLVIGRALYSELKKDSEEHAKVFSLMTWQAFISGKVFDLGEKDKKREESTND